MLRNVSTFLFHATAADFFSSIELGDPVDDLAVATVLMMVGGKLVLLRPQKSGRQEVKYDMQILEDRIEFCWIHLRGIGALENSLWGYDGRGIRVWLNALNLESSSVAEEDAESVEASVNIPLDFYPLCKSGRNCAGFAFHSPP